MKFIAWLVALFWRKEGDKVSASIADAIVIKGVPIKVADVKAVALAIGAIWQGRADGKGAAQIESEIAPMLLGVAEDVAAMAFPCFGGPAVAMIAFAFEHSVPFTSLSQDEQNRIMEQRDHEAGFADR